MEAKENDRENNKDSIARIQQDLKKSGEELLHLKEKIEQLAKQAQSPQK